MADEVAEVVERVAVVREQTEGVLRHVGAGLQEDVLAFGHTYAAVAGSKLDAFGAFADGAEGFGVDVQNLAIGLGDAFVGEEESDSGVAPEVARLRVVIVAVSRVLITPDDECAAGLPHSEVALGDLERVDERRAGGGEHEGFGVGDGVAVLGHVGGGADGVVGGVGGGDEEIHLMDVVRQARQGVVDGFEAHRVDVFVGASARSCSDAGALHDPFVAEAGLFRVVGVGDPLFGNIESGCINIHRD